MRRKKGGNISTYYGRARTCGGRKESAGEALINCWQSTFMFKFFGKEQKAGVGLSS